MDLATLIGMLGAFAIVAMAMLMGGSITLFINPPSILIVFGGSLFVVLIKYTLAQFLGAAKIAAKAFMFKASDQEALIEEIAELADIARKGGLLSLEGKEVSEPFLEQGITLLVDGHDPEVVREMLTKDMKKTVERHELGKSIFSALGDVGPAMGMIGTLIGLVQMLSAMDDPKSIGPAMAVALMTTLYGAMLATMIALPVADKLGLRSVEEATTRAMIIDALLAIQAGQNPRVIKSMLKTYLPPSKRGEEEE